MNLFPGKITPFHIDNDTFAIPGFILKIMGLLIITCISTVTVDARQSAERGKISGLLYSDFYWVVNNHNEELEGNNGFWARRVYFTYDRDLSSAVTTRLRLEMNSPGDYTTSFKLEPYVKDLYVKWAMNDNHNLIAGISPTPTWGLIESLWGYRSVEKSPADLYKLGSSREFGLALQGQLGEARKVRYHAMVGNGSGTGGETNRWKKYMLSLAWWLNDNFVVEIYGDYTRLSDTHSRATAQGFAGYVSDKANLGAMYATQSRMEEVPGVGDNTDILDLVSFFSNFSLNEKWTAIFRADHMFVPNPDGPSIDYIPFSDQAESTLLILGVGYEPISGLQLIPNIETVFYGEAPDGTTPGSDLIFRTTLYYNF